MSGFLLDTFPVHGYQSCTQAHLHGLPLPKGVASLFFPWYYGGSVALRLASFRRSRFCAYETFSVFRCLFVPYLVHYQLFIGGGCLQTDYLCTFPISPSHAWFDGCGLTSYRNLGSAIDQLHHYPRRGLLAHRTCGPMRYMLSPMFRVMSMLLSTFDFRRRVSSCPRGFSPFLSRVTRGFHMHRHGAQSEAMKSGLISKRITWAALR